MISGRGARSIISPLNIKFDLLPPCDGRRRWSIFLLSLKVRALGRQINVFIRVSGSEPHSSPWCSHQLCFRRSFGAASLDKRRGRAAVFLNSAEIKVPAGERVFKSLFQGLNWKHYIAYNRCMTAFWRLNKVLFISEAVKPPSSSLSLYRLPPLIAIFFFFSANTSSVRDHRDRTSSLIWYLTPDKSREEVL